MNETASELMRRAAKRLRDAAECMPSGPWRYEGSGEWECAEGCCWDFWDDRVSSTYSGTIQEFSNPAYAKWFALMQPPVALAMADMLDHKAELIDSVASISAYGGIIDDICGLDTAIARAVLDGDGNE